MTPTTSSPRQGRPFTKGMIIAMLSGIGTMVADVQAHSHCEAVTDGHMSTVMGLGAALGLLTFLGGHVNGFTAGNIVMNNANANDNGEDKAKINGGSDNSSNNNDRGFAQ